jgi:predicted nucleotidyltransferase
MVVFGSCARNETADERNVDICIEKGWLIDGAKSQ